MFRFTIRELLLLMLVVGLAVGWWHNRGQWAAERQALIETRDADVANERRLGELRAREAAGRLVSRPQYGRPANGPRQSLKRPPPDENPTVAVPLSK
jgi:hypothetical protein